MRYAVPVNAASEVPALREAGADELYCGYQDVWWTSRYGDHDSASRRQGSANLASLGELRACMKAARESGMPLWLALNSRYTEPQLDYLVDLCRRFGQMGGTGIILSDLGLLWRLRDSAGLRLCLSLLAVAQNVPTLRAYRSLGVSRVVFPRFVGPQEAAHLVAGACGLEAEVMAFFDKCPWVDGYCRHRHGVSYPPRDPDPHSGKVAPALMRATSHGLVAPDSRAPISVGQRPGTHASVVGDAPPLYTFDTTYRTHACLGKACDYLEPYPCAACMLPAFQSAGAGIAKLGGRGRPLDERLRAVRFLKAAEALGTDTERAQLYRATFGQPCACYYGASTQRRSAIEPVDNPPGQEGRWVLGSQTNLDVYQRDLALLVSEAGDMADASGAMSLGTLPLALSPGRGQVRGDCSERPVSSSPITLLVPPLGDADLSKLIEVLPALCKRSKATLRLYANDLGTLLSLASRCSHEQLRVELVAGTLLERSENPVEVAHFLSADDNPARCVWDFEGRPRVLTYQRPPQNLIEHWSRPSLLEPSAQVALRYLMLGV